jgi:diguanylate cyclase (GGDEF)-like protein
MVGGFTVIVVDIDHFKSVNDGRGRRIRDAVLTEVAWRMATCAGPYDTVGPSGGEESGIVARSCQRSGAAGPPNRISSGHPVYTNLNGRALAYL